jgi:hypothetical protein
MEAVVALCAREEGAELAHGIGVEMAGGSAGELEVALRRDAATLPYELGRLLGPVVLGLVLLVAGFAGAGRAVLPVGRFEELLGSFARLIRRLEHRFPNLARLMRETSGHLDVGRLMSNPVDRLLAEAEEVGETLDRAGLERLARDDPEAFGRMAIRVRDELEERTARAGGVRRAQAAADIAEAGGQGRRLDVPPEGTRRANAIRTTNRTSHDAGVEGGRLQAARDRIVVHVWDNPESYKGDFGEGFDDVGERGNELIILEWKGETSPLAPNQMTDTWVGARIARLKWLNDDIADDLLFAAREGRLRGRVYRTVIRPGGRLSASLDGDEIRYDPNEIVAAFDRELARLRHERGRPRRRRR